MALAVVNYLELNQEDLDWIQGIRRRHDELFFDVIAPHFPLVFPTDAIDQDELLQHVTESAVAFHPFEVVFRCAVLGDPDFMGHAHAFLTPDEGFSEIVRLHDRLYTGPLASELRLDLPFMPHVGIAGVADPHECKRIVDEINEDRFAIRSRVKRLDVIGYDGQKVWTVEKVPLAEPRAGHG